MGYGEVYNMGRGGLRGIEGVLSYVDVEWEVRRAWWATALDSSRSLGMTVGSTGWGVGDGFRLSAAGMTGSGLGGRHCNWGWIHAIAHLRSVSGHGVGGGLGVASRNHDGLVLQGHPPLGPSTLLPPWRIYDRVSGPSRRWDRVYTNRRNRTLECRIANGI